MKFFMKSIIATTMISSLGLASAACNVDRWDGKNADAKSVVDGASRYEGLCALDGTTGKVTKSIAGSGDTYFRFYVIATGNESNLTIFRATGGANADVKINGGNIELGSAKVPFSSGKWHNVEVHLNGTNAKIKVDGKNEQSATIAGLGNISNVELGKISGNVSDKLYFDAFVASNGQAIGNASVSLDEAGKTDKMVAGDANGSGDIDPDDIVTAREEVFAGIFGFSPSIESFLKGVPDMNKDGYVTPQDIVLMNDKIFNDLFGNP